MEKASLEEFNKQVQSLKIFGETFIKEFIKSKSFKKAIKAELDSAKKNI